MASLSAFNPHDFSEATVRTVATGRDGPLAQVLATVRGNLDAATRQHLIVSAPRGYGKSFLMRHVQFDIARAVRDEGLPLAVVLMPEEMPHVKEPETLVRELTRALNGGAASEAELTWHEDDGAAWDGAVDDLHAAIRDKVGPRGLVVALVENFDVLLRRAFPKEVQASRLRALLTDRGSRLMLVAASATGAFDRDYDDRLFHAFEEVPLEPWSVEECMAFFDRQREEAGRPPLDAAARARGNAVASFIGGTPRLATLLGDALFDDDVLRAADLLRTLVDELTPYYKERIEALPGRTQKLLDALLRGGEPATSSEVARRVRARSQAAIAGRFNDIVKERIIVGTKAPGSAEVLYRVADRVFAHYYRRRILDHEAEGCPLEALVDLLAQFFTPEEQRIKAADFARLGRRSEARLMARLHARSNGTTVRDRSILDNLATRLIPRWWRPLASEAIAGALDALVAAARQGDADRASAVLDAVIYRTGPSDRVLLLLVRSEFDRYEGIDDGRIAAREAFDLSMSLAGSLVHLEAAATWLWHLAVWGRYDDALIQGERATTEAARWGRPDYESRISRHIAWVLGRLDRNEEAIASARQAASLARTAGEKRQEAMALDHVAFNLGQISQHAEAVAVARQAADLARAVEDGRQEAEALSHAAFSLGQMRRHEEAVATARQAASLARDAGEEREEAMALDHAAFSLRQLGLHEEAIATARQAAGLARAAGDRREEAVALLHAAFSLGRLGRHVEVLASAQQAAASARAAGETRIEAEAFGHEAFSLRPLGRHEEAVATARRAADLARVAGDHEEEALDLALASWCLADIGDHATAVEMLSAAAATLDGLPDEERWHLVPVYPPHLGRQAASSFASDARPDAVHALLRLAADRLGHLGTRQVCLEAWLRAFIDTGIRLIEVPERLDAWATAIAMHAPAPLRDMATILHHAARYHASHRSRAALARLDPDVALTLETMFPPTDDTPIKPRNTAPRRTR